ncbi:MAG: glutamate-5-semialdehyde dehydrogenase [Geminocystis sp.]|nr:glutamate-5-semialdehyde dehydrogenase [Geminocystis sp.]MCS7148340.1 glutamate-5-semialdehyde dehydrogenase [Geminocystis sp.]MCX8078346.1 glutamate-5-semialdehyde dehydrogenase [Geminocystis sp.]MDW8116072.1 glutamate-5-semialdehyde dehydrogenase [Geminocystis sp.]HIK38936.1 glutamate-5-semialdehyde dehydrogenase [Geminocystis sp. M7585_C2015_104]
MMSDLVAIAQESRKAASQLADSSEECRNNALLAIAEALTRHQGEIFKANQKDCESAAGVISPALYARLQLGESKLKSVIQGIHDLIRLPDPLGHVSLKRELDTDLILERVSCPLGVIGVIFEARPEALIQIATLAIKSGNAVILKGGKEAIHSCTTLTQIIQNALQTAGINPKTVQLLTTREEINALLSLDKYIDLIIPRGSNSFVRYVQENTKIPVIGHADGICHLYIDAEADLQQAVSITVDAKTQYPAACNAIETLLIHKAVAKEFLPPIAAALREKGVTIRGDAATREIIEAEEATELDWQTEYCDLILSVKVVDSLMEAIDHINRYGSKHTDAIVTNKEENAEKFLNLVDSAGVYHNCSTRFADGFRYGFGAEVGISTQKMPPRGPVGLEGLVTYKYKLRGKGHIVADYAENRRKFTHKDLL